MFTHEIDSVDFIFLNIDTDGNRRWKSYNSRPMPGHRSIVLFEPESPVIAQCCFTPDESGKNKAKEKGKSLGVMRNTFVYWK